MQVQNKLHTTVNDLLYTPLAKKCDQNARIAQEHHDDIQKLKTMILNLVNRVDQIALTSHDATFTWRICDVMKKRQDAIAQKVTSIYSLPFYSRDQAGYKMFLRAYFDGDGPGSKTHISIFFGLQSGEYDEALSWPFDHSISLKILDQSITVSKNKRHCVHQFRSDPTRLPFQKPKTNESNVAAGVPQFAPLLILNNKKYVVNDVMFIQCTVHILPNH